MYQGNHRARKSYKRWNKSMTLLVSVLLLLGITISGTVAFLLDVAGPVDNVFSVSKVTTEVVETLKDGVKSNVMIQNTGDTTAYIRAAVVVTWQDENGNIYGTSPIACTKTKDECDHQSCEADYAIMLNLGEDWQLSSDGFYYYTKPVDAGKSTTALINECTQLKTTVVGETTYSLAVEIIGSGIQSVPTDVVISEWSSGVSGVKDGTTLTIKTSQGGN